MSYLRWDSSSDWYVFWESSSPPERQQQRLAIWHCEARDQMFAATYAVVRTMLSTSDFSSIPGYSERYRDQIREALNSFVEDVDRDFGSG